MKRIEIMTVMALMAIVFIGCNSIKEKKVPFEEPVFENPYRDTTIYGFCGSGSAPNVLQLVTDNGDTLFLGTTRALEAGQVFGGYKEGDHMAVIVNTDSTLANLVINQTALIGSWVMPNPIDGSDEVGFSLREGGVAESIEQSSLIYQTWRIFNGRLELQAIRDGGGDMEEVVLYQMVLLQSDSLIIKDSDDTYEYGRQKPHTEYSDIQLEESSFDDFKM